MLCVKSSDEDLPSYLACSVAQLPLFLLLIAHVMVPLFLCFSVALLPILPLLPCYPRCPVAHVAL